MHMEQKKHTHLSNNTYVRDSVNACEYKSNSHADNRVWNKSGLI